MNFEDIHFKPLITVVDKARLVSAIVDSVFVDDEFIPEIFDEQFWIYVASAYRSDGGSQEYEVDEFMGAFYAGGIHDRMVDEINIGQLASVRTAVNKRIELRMSKKPSDMFFDSATALLNKISEAVEQIDLSGVSEYMRKLDVGAELAKVLDENRKQQENDMK